MYHVHYLCSATSAVLLSPHRRCRSFPGDLRIRPRHHIEEVQQSLGCISRSAYHSDLRSCRAVVLLVPRRRMSLLSAHSFRDIFRSAASAFAPPNLPRAWNQAHSPSSPIPGVKEESESALSAFSTDHTPLVLHSAASRVGSSCDGVFYTRARDKRGSARPCTIYLAGITEVERFCRPRIPLVSCLSASSSR